MEDKKIIQKMSHNVIMEGRKKLSVSAVEEIISFDEKEVNLKTSMGALLIKGNNLKINKLSVETGDVDIMGGIDSLSYKSQEGTEEKGFFGKLFK